MEMRSGSAHLLRDESLVMLLDLVDATIGGGIGTQELGKRPFVDCIGVVWLEHGGTDERFEDEPSAKIDSAPRG